MSVFDDGSSEDKAVFEGRMQEQTKAKQTSIVLFQRTKVRVWEEAEFRVQLAVLRELACVTNLRRSSVRTDNLSWQ